MASMASARGLPNAPHGSAFLQVHLVAAISNGLIVKHEPTMADGLEAAAGCYDEERTFLGKMHEATGGFIASDEQLDRRADPTARQEIAAAVLQARDRDSQVTDHIGRALAR